MATVTGTLADFGLSLLTAYSPKIIFTPSGPATGPGAGSARFLLATRPIECIPAPDGKFSVELYPNEASIPATHYTIRIEWRDPNAFDDDRGYVGRDDPDWELVVPNLGGSIADLLKLPSNPAQTWVGDLPPDNPTPGTWWLLPSTGDIFEWSN
jgi:hypothetical protein